MKVYVDCDVAVKMAKWGLLRRLAQHLSKQGGAELYTVSTLKYKFKLADKAKAVGLLGSSEAYQQLVDFVQLCKEPKGHNAQVLEALVDVPSVDGGEAALFAAAAHFDSALVDTGDKNALRALAGLGAGHVAVQALQGKLACLEQTLYYLVDRWTFDVVQKAVTADIVADAACSRCFNGKTAVEAVGSLHEHVERLRAQCGSIIHVAPFAWVP